MKYQMIVLSLILLSFFSTTEALAGEDEKANTVTKGAVTLTPCQVQGADGELLCGEYEVFENRETMKGRKIKLRIVIAPATGKTPKPDPIFFFSGGPGQGSADIAGYATRGMEDLRVDRDLVFVDQRGTGGSNPLLCPQIGPVDSLQTYLGNMYPEEYVKNCRAHLESKADLKTYTTDNLADDHDELRAALGYDKINLFGGSYGTRASLVYMRRHPESVRSATLMGLAPPSGKVPASFAIFCEQAMDKLLVDCAADPDCHKNFPDLEANLKQVLAKVKANPVSLEVDNPFTQKKETVRFGYAPMISILRAMLYSTRNSSRLPAIVALAAQGNYEPFVLAAARYVRGINEGIADGLYLSTTCAEDLPFIDVGAERKAAVGTFIGEYRINEQSSACQLWPRGKISSDFHEPVKCSAPTLLISGSLDPVTPPSRGALVAKHLPNSRHVVIAKAAHGAGRGTPCMKDMIRQFLDQGSAKGLDTSCVSAIKRPPFLTVDELLANISR